MTSNDPTPRHRASRTSSTPLSASLRPRKGRLVSEDASAADDSESGVSPMPSPSPSRNASPIPSTRLPRTGSSRPVPRSDPLGNVGLKAPAAAKDSLAAIENWWGSSWSAVQGMATNVLGSNTLEATKDKPAQRRRRAADSSRTRTSTSAPPSKWGPQESMKDKDIGSSSKEDREAMVRAKKRESMMAANGHMYPDAIGRFKRRNSDDRVSSSAPPAESDDRDALVYVHKVKPNDTLAGLTIKYNCQAAVLRKANRMWPSDTIQIRKTIILPVDACGIKGKMVPEAQKEPEDLLGVGYDSEATTPTANSGLSNGWNKGESSGQSLAADSRPLSSAASVASSHADAEPPWKHDSWVMLPNDTNPTEIARLPRRNLGFFPAARRKSLTFSDATPPPSLDLPRSTASNVNSPLPSPLPSASNSQLHLPSSARTSPGGGSTRSASRRRRNDSISTSNPNFLPFHGPGGVGTFNRNVRKPGPANDGLNKIFGPHLPNLRPPRGHEEQSSWFGGGWNPLQLDPEAAAIPGATGQGQVGGSGVEFDFEKAAGAVEGWARKMWGKASSAINESPRPGTSPGGSAAPGKQGVSRGAVPMGYGEDVSDLIEMTDSFEIGGDDEDEDEDDELGRGRQGMVASGSRDATETLAGRRERRGKSGKGE